MMSGTLVRGVAIAVAGAVILCACESRELAPGWDGGVVDAGAGGQDGAVDATVPDAGAEPVYGLCEPNNEPFPARPTPAAAPTKPFLHVSGTDVVDEGGARVALRGMNFGSWLMMENWIPGIGVLFEEDLLGMIPQKAEVHGIAALVEEARNANLLDWVSERKPHWVLVQEWRTYTTRHAADAQKAGVAAFWEWFDSEPWIFEERSLWRWLTGRFGFEKAAELRAAFQDHYITEVDVQRLAALGLNLIRVPIWYDALETDYLGENRFKPDGWERLDRLARWARTLGVYLMLDLHGAPGGQSTAWHTGLEDGGALWTTQRCIDKTARLWRAIASYFAEDPHIAIYDLLNEPMGAPDHDAYAAVHDALYRAIREVDTTHIVMAEDGYRPPGMLSSPSEMGWQNAMFSVHMYPGGTSADDYLSKIEGELAKIATYYPRFNVPLFLGEFSAADGTDTRAWAPDAMGKVLATLDRSGIHWAPWTWKFYADDTIWGLYRPKDGPGRRIDVKDASFDEIKAAFEALESVNFDPDPGYEQAIMDNAPAEPAPLDLSGDGR